MIREAITDWLEKHSGNEWSKSILQFDGIKEFPTIEELREGITDSKSNLF